MYVISVISEALCVGEVCPPVFLKSWQLFLQQLQVWLTITPTSLTLCTMAVSGVVPSQYSLQ